MQKRESRYYEEIEIGDEIGPVEKYIADEDVEAFCRLWGAPVPNRFTDEDSAALVNLSWPIVPGIMSMAIMSQLFTTWEGATLKHLDVVFRQPVPHDVVAITAIVTDKREENDEYLAECDVYLSTEENGRLVGGKAIIELASQVEAEAAATEPDDDEEFEDDDLDDDFDEDEDDLDDDDTEEDQPEGDAPGAEEPAQDDPAQDGSDGDDGPAEEVVTNEQGEGGGDEKAG
jgi:acyl dehydratase